MPRVSSSVAFVVVALGLFATGPRAAIADEPDKESCVEAHSEAQRSRKRGELLDARERLATCARDACPDLVAKDCTEWLAEMSSAIPSVVIRAVDGAGRETADVAVVVDGVRVTERLDGRALEIDPGEHVFRFEAGGAVVEQKVLLSEGERRRTLSVRFPPLPSQPAAIRRPEQPDRAGVPTATWILGGVAVASLGVFTGFAISGRVRQDDLEQCAPNCAQADVDVMRTRYLVADVGLIAGLIAGGAATWLALR